MNNRIRDLIILKLGIEGKTVTGIKKKLGITG